ncbi:MAG: type II secretion system F family protein [Planctomycetota bacterium]
MTQFSFRAIPLERRTGDVIDGVREASDVDSLRSALREQGLVMLSARPLHVADAIRARLRRDRPRSSDGRWFFSTLRTMLASKVPIESALGTMSELAPGPRVRAVCDKVRGELRAGRSLPEAIASIERLAQPHHLAIIESGSAAGRLDHAIELVDAQLARSEALRKTLVARLTYPVILLIAAVGVVWFLATFVIPKFAETLSAMGGEMPGATALTLAAADHVVWIVPALFVVVLLLAGARDVLLGPAGKRRVSALVLKTPIVGDLVWHAQSAIVADIIATMIEGGGELLAGVDQAVGVVRSPVLAERLRAARDAVSAGADIGEAFSEQQVFPPMCAAVVRVGVKAGELGPALRRASLMAGERQEALTQRLLTFMQPAVVLLLAGVVLWVVYSLIIGMLAINDVGTL